MEKLITAHFSNQTITNATRSLDAARYAKLVRTLTSFGRPLNKALHDVAVAYALSAKQVKSVIKLLNV